MTTNFVQYQTARQIGGSLNNAVAQNNAQLLPYRYAQRVLNNDTLQINEKVDNAKEKVQIAAQNIDKNKLKKNITTATLTIATVLGVTAAVNKNINKIWQLGESVDKIVKNSKFCNKAGEVLNSISAKNPLKKSKLFQEVKNVTSSANRVQPKSQMAKMSVLGPKGIFSLTSSEILKNIADGVGDKTKFTKYLEALVGKDSKICGKTIQEMAEACFSGKDLGDSFKFSKELVDAIKTKHNLKSTKEMLKFFDNVKIGKIGEETFDFAKNIKVKGWVPGSRGNLGETLKKFVIMNGDAAQTTAGKLTQQIPLILGESVGNCINDRTTFGVLMTASYLPQIFNEAQDAPTGKKAKTAISELISGAAGWAIGMASAGAIVYSAASLKNIKSSTAAANILKKFGNVASMGLKDGSSKTAKILGGILRFAGVLTLSGKISAPIDNTIKKSFGLPTAQEKEKLEQQKQQQYVA